MELSAGRELDALVAEKVMGWIPSTSPRAERPWQMAPSGSGPGSMSHVPHYSTDIADAWLIVERFNTRAPDLFARFAEHLYEDDGTHRYCQLLDVPAYEAAYRICLAALRAVGAL